MGFSIRHGHKKVKDIQLNDIDHDLRNKLWNSIWNIYLDHKNATSLYQSIPINFFKPLWERHYKLKIDEYARLSNTYDNYYKDFRRRYDHSAWYEIYDLLEFIARTYSVQSDLFISECNNSLTSELSGYRFVDGIICPITNEVEIKEIESALQSPIEGVRAHIQTSLDLFASKQNPDYRNSIKESISAIESLCKIITEDPNATLGKALDKIESQKKIILPPSLKQAFDKLYGYTSTSQGIRHGLTEEANLQQDDARFFLIACSAFVNYLTSKSIAAGISLH